MNPDQLLHKRKQLRVKLMKAYLLLAKLIQKYHSKSEYPKRGVYNLQNQKGNKKRAEAVYFSNNPHGSGLKNECCNQLNLILSVSFVSRNFIFASSFWMIKLVSKSLRLAKSINLNSGLIIFFSVFSCIFILPQTHTWCILDSS